MLFVYKYPIPVSDEFTLDLPKGARVLTVESERRGLKATFLRRGIVWCELRFKGCYRDTFLGFAHARKRRKL